MYGLGHYFRNCTEHMMIFANRKVKALKAPIRNVIHSPSGKRTIKPKNFEVDILNLFNERNMQNFAYIFSGLENKPFKDYNIDLVDIELIDK